MPRSTVVGSLARWVHVVKVVILSLNKIILLWFPVNSECRILSSLKKNKEKKSTECLKHESRDDYVMIV